MIVVAALWTGFFIINFNIAMMIPLLPFIERDIGLSASEAGMVLAAFPVVALASNLALGPFIDRFGRKRFIVTGAVACALLLLLTATARHALPIALARAATGLFMPMIGASIFAAIADYCPPADRARVAGYVTSAAPIAFLASISMGVVLRELLLILLAGGDLPVRYRDHPLKGSWKGFRDAYIEPDWLLIYRVDGSELQLARTGSHSDLFDE